MHSNNSSTAGATKAGWRVNEFSADTGVSVGTVYALLSAGRIKSVKVGAIRVITTPPAEFLASFSDEAA